MTTKSPIPRAISIKELTTFIEDRQYYIDQGYPFKQAEQRAYDHMHINRRNKS